MHRPVREAREGADAGVEALEKQVEAEAVEVAVGQHQKPDPRPLEALDATSLMRGHQSALAARSMVPALRRMTSKPMRRRPKPTPRMRAEEAGAQIARMGKRMRRTTPAVGAEELHMY